MVRSSQTWYLSTLYFGYYVTMIALTIQNRKYLGKFGIPIIVRVVEVIVRFFFLRNLLLWLVLKPNECNGVKWEYNYVRL